MKDRADAEDAEQPTVDTQMTGLILLAIAVAIISAVTVDLVQTNRGDSIGARILAEDKRRKRAERRFR